MKWSVKWRIWVCCCGLVVGGFDWSYSNSIESCELLLVMVFR